MKVWDRRKLEVEKGVDEETKRGIRELSDEELRILLASGIIGSVYQYALVEYLERKSSRLKGKKTG